MKDENFLATIILIFLILALPLAVFLVRKQWIVKKAAELPSPIIFSLTEGEFAVNETFTVNLLLNTKEQPIEGLDLVVDAHNLEMEVEPASLPEGLTWQKEPEVFKGTLKMSILTQSGQSFSNNELEPLVNLNLRGRVYCQTAGLTVDKNFSVVAANGQNILGELLEPSFTLQTPAGITNPEFTSPAETEAVSNQEFFYTATATNPNNGALEFAFYHLPDFLTANGSILSGTPTEAGEYQIDIEVIDGQGGSACAVLDLTVSDSTPTPTPTPTPASPTATPTIPSGKTLNIKFQFQGKKENQNNHPSTIWVKETGLKKTFTGNSDGTYSFDIKGELANRETPYEILLKGYQNLAVKRTIAIHDGPNPTQGYLDFSQLFCGDIAPVNNTDNMVNSLDWGYMADEWNIEKSKESVADINDDFRVNSLDYSLLISRFGLRGEE